MPSPELLDFTALIAPVPGADPAGQPLSYADRERLDKSRLEPDPLEPSTSDRRADWKGIIQLASDTLENKSKDLLVAIRLLEALVKQAKENKAKDAPSAFVALRDGCKLLKLMVENCWDRMHPIPEPGEGMEARVGPFNWLNNMGKGAKFPSTILSIPFFRRGGEDFSYFEFSNNARRADFDAALASADGKKMKEAYDDLKEAFTELRDLNRLLDEKFSKDDSPSLADAESPDNIGQALHTYQVTLEALLKQKGIGTSGESQEASDEGSSASEAEGGDGGIAPISAGKTNREGLYRQLEQIADALQRIEPHSPIPYLMKRAVRLGTLPFPELMRAIIRETTTLDELDRLLGLEQKPPE